MRVARALRRGTRGQVIPLVSLAMMLLVGAAAIGIDLSLQTHNQRALQNATDAAALAGAVDLPISPAAADQYQAAQDALLLIHKTMAWPTFSGSNTLWAQTAASPCSPTNNTTTPPSCDITVTPPAPYTNFTITVQTPAKSSMNPVYQTDLHYLDVIIRQKTQNNFAAVIGFNSSTEAARSTAYHFAGGQAYGFALFSKQYAHTQNSPSTVSGDVYVERYIAPQSNGKASFCAEGGLIVLGFPQIGDPSYQNDGQYDLGTQVINYPPSGGVNGDCGDGAGNINVTSGGTVNQTRNPQAGCSNVVTGVSFTGAYNTTLKTCVVNPPLVAPALEEPTLVSNPPVYCGAQGKDGMGNYRPGVYQCAGATSLSIDAPLNPGVYEIRACAGCSGVSITSNIALHNVTFILENGSSFEVRGNSVTVSVDPYVPSPATQNPADGTYPIYAPAGSAASVSVDKNSASLTTYGTLYVPDGSVNVTSNAQMTVIGQAIVNQWNDQGGNHPSVDVQYDASRNAPQREVLRLVE
jgi:Flp pilus assembly protein TadG